MQPYKIEPDASREGGGTTPQAAESNSTGADSHVDAPATAIRRRALAQLASVVMGIVAITCYVQFGPKGGQPPLPAPAATSTQAPKPDTEPIPEAAESEPAEEESVADSGPPKVAEPPPPPPLDRVAVSRAEAELDAASRDRARAEARAESAARLLAKASTQAALDANRARKLAYQVRDPSTRIAQASARGGFLRGQRDKIASEVTTLRSLPRPKSASILSKSPVAKPAYSDEYHFELRHNRVTFIDLNKLLELTKADAQVRIRMADRLGAISNKVGPAGAFSLEYELVRAAPGSMEELIQRRSVRFDLSSWELVPESENRGETYEATRNPISEFTRALNRINPGRATITLWVYPDSFSLFRRLRDELTDRGFSVAARPLPEGLAIRGSPMGTQSAAQ